MPAALTDRDVLGRALGKVDRHLFTKVYRADDDGPEAADMLAGALLAALHKAGWEVTRKG